MRLNSSKRALIAGTSGTALQWYDFAIFGYFAPVIAATFFPANNAIAALLSAFGLFAVGYFLAPLGSIVFGYIGDRYGRKKALTLSILGMAIPTAIIGVLPGYQSIGLLAPLLVTVLRMMQGFVASSEFSGSAIFLVEHAKPGQKAFYGCLTSISYSLGVIIAGLTASFLTSSFMPEWGWRIGFVISLIAGIVIFYLRNQVSETPTYQKISSKDKPRLPIFTAFKLVPSAFFGVIGIAWFTGIMTFGTYVFAASFLHIYFKLPLSSATLITTLALAVDVIIEPLMAILADKIGHLRIIMTGILLVILCSFPAFYLITSNNIALIIMGMALLSFLIAITFAPMNAYTVELFPESCRYSGFGVSFHLGISLFGGTSPLFLLWLVEKTGNIMAPAYYYIFGAVIGLASICLCEYGRLKKGREESILVY
ncbi:MAG: MFS transporter [Legionellaceae bacterium]|nr:MFS transporter [Legionellaceae bacterium]